jgi:hypothetical protein
MGSQTLFKTRKAFLKRGFLVLETSMEMTLMGRQKP